MSFNYRFSGSFTSANPAASHDVELPAGEPDYFRIRNRTAWGDDAAETSVEANWWRGMAFDAAQTIDQAVTSGNLSSEAITASGFRFIDTFNPPTFTANGISSITAADPAVVSVDSSTGSIAVGDVVRITESTGMLQIAGYDFTVDAVSTDTSVTLQLDAQNFAAAATDGNVRLIIPSRFYPRWRYIVPLENTAGITQEAEAVVTTSVNHDFTVGEKVTFRVTEDYGMSEINNVRATVLSRGNVSGGTYTAAVTGPFNALRIALDTSSFTAFSFPTSATFAAGATPAVIMPAGAGPEDGANPPGVPVDAAFDNRNRFVMRIGTNIITSASAVYDWEAFYSTKHVAE